MSAIFGNYFLMRHKKAPRQQGNLTTKDKYAMNIIAQNTPLTMSTREIAELTEKNHLHVLRDVKVMFEQLEINPDGYIQNWIHPQNKQSYIEYILPKDLTVTLVSGYNIKMRHAITKRWMELESQSQPKIPSNFAEALQLAADQAKQLELAAPKVAFVDNLVDRTALLNATQVGQKHKLSAVKLNRILMELNVYNRNVKRGKAFQQWFIDKGYGEMKQSEQGYSQAMFTNAGEVWVNQQLVVEGIV